MDDDARSVEALLGLVPLRVGERVRVRLSGECPGVWFDMYGIYAPHVDANDGKVGRIVGIGQPYPERNWGHTYAVLFDGWRACVFYARAELERVADGEA